MRREIALLTMSVILLLLFLSFFRITAYMKTSNGPSPNSNINQPVDISSNQKTDENVEPQNCVAIDEKGEENQQTCEKTLENRNPSTDANYTSPPDGRIYLTEDEPYPYLPTQTPKGWGKLPILPPNTES